MPSAANTPGAPRPSVFISYASEDRAAARALRDALLAAGLEAWYDENELGGGDAWDQKIRRQIRDCDYFMPVISAATERRKEGYFRREWRLAAERTLDMADDVLFLLPVVIDDTLEGGARVPEKFLTVQWLRAPGGQRTAAFDSLVQRLLAGEHTIAPRPPLLTRPSVPAAAGMTMPPVAAPAPAATHGHAPPPMPEFPHHPEKGGVGPWLKYSAEVLWWFVTATWILLTRLPRWLRIILSIWLVITLITTCGRNDNKTSAPPTQRQKHREKPPAPPAAEADFEKKINATAEQIVGAIEKGATSRDWNKIGEDLARRFGGKIEQSGAMGKVLAVAPFPRDAQHAESAQFAQAAFSVCYGQLVLARKTDVAISPVLPTGNSDAGLTAIGQQLHTDLMLGARWNKREADGRTLMVRLVRSADGSIVWSGDFSADGDAADAGAKIAEAVLKAMPAGKQESPPRN